MTADGHLVGVKDASEQALRVTFVGTELGLIAVARTDKGISSILFGENRGQLVVELSKGYSRDNLSFEDRPDETAERIARFIECPRLGLDDPLDIRGTDFQRRVWNVLREIPAGSRVSYGEVARLIGQPGSARAVARACASNRIAVAIPCHRVVRSDGALSGYVWGVERKGALLRREQERP